MSQPDLSANPEFLLHYERLHRDRIWMRQRAYVLFAAASLLVAVVVLVSIGSQQGESERFVPLALFFGLAVLLICNGVMMLYRARRPISEGEVVRRRQEERQQLFQFAQGRISWRYWFAVVIQVLVGLLFLALGFGAVGSLMVNWVSLDLLNILLTFSFVLIGWYSLSSALRRVRMLRRLTQLSSQELANRLSLGEATEGE